MNASPVLSLKLSDFDFHLPESRIAQHPCPARDGARLLLLDRSSGNRFHHQFSDIERFLEKGDVLVINNTRVFPCRIVLQKAGGACSEIFLLSEQGPNCWTALVKGKTRSGKRFAVAPGIEAEVVGEESHGIKSIRFVLTGNIRNLLPTIGRTPLPPYIKRDATAADQERYQTVYAEHEGAVAAPTAGLHFTGHLLRNLQSKGIEVAPITLHVGPGTFQPVRTEIVTEHRMHAEEFEISADSADRINRAISEGRRIIAVGTTSVRALESAASANGRIAAGKSSTSIFIYPGFSFKVIDALITNFHLPKSTLLMLVCAFAGQDITLAAYREAIDKQYRFYSYGDAMFIV